jgi:cytochrome c2
MKPALSFIIFLISTATFAADAQHGKKLFVERACNSCHSIGKEGTAQTGPNLEGVTERRDRTWLKKWLTNPDLMRKDPIIEAMALKYKAPMPNLGLTSTEVDDLLAYLGSASPQKSK